MASVAGGPLGQTNHNTLSSGIISCMNAGAYGPSTSSSMSSCVFPSSSRSPSRNNDINDMASNFFQPSSCLSLPLPTSSCLSLPLPLSNSTQNSPEHPGMNGIQNYLQKVFTPIRAKRSIAGTPPTPEPLPIDFLNDILQAVTGEDSPMCTNCEDGATATCRCKECSEMLCVLCVKAHRRVRVTKDHRIIPFNNVSPPPVPAMSGSPSSIASSLHSLSPCSSPATCCDYHNDTSRLYCQNCFTPACPDCIQQEHTNHTLILYRDAADNAKSFNIKLTREANHAMFFLKDGLQTLQNLYKSVNIRSQHAVNDVHTIMERFVQAIEERERELVNKIEEIRSNKTKALYAQICFLHSTFAKLNQASEALRESLDVTSSYEAMHANDKIALELKHIRSIRSEFVPNEDDVLIFLPPDSRLLRTVASIGHISTCSQSPVIRPKQPQNREGQILPFIAPFRAEKNDTRGRPIHGAMNSISVKRPSSPQFFSGEGSVDGLLCRPWGVCCDKMGNIIVADRTNHRIQVFCGNGLFSHKFGTNGSGPGQFDRPAGVTVDPVGRVVVADKDNHRVQIFNIDGNFLMKFGERGCRPGQFNYPWDVATNSHGQICVSDTRNHRIQLFSGEGIFLRKFGFEGTQHQWRSFDSPRGVCFDPHGHVLVTDFNNHRVVIVDSTFTKGRYLGSEGSGQKQFLRPQGIVCDDQGRIVIADSRNNRIVVYEGDGKFLWEVGKAGKNLGELDRPSGICLNTDGRVIVVDFGNSRVQIF